MVAAGKYGDYFETTPFSYTFTFEASDDLGVMVKAHTFAVRPEKEKYAYPEIAPFLLANCFGRRFALFKGPGHDNYEKELSGLQKLNDTVARTYTLQHCVMRLQGTKNLLVGFNVV